jgi:hypothetical protein
MCADGPAEKTELGAPLLESSPSAPSMALNGAFFAPQAIVEFSPPPEMISSGKPDPAS